MSLGDPIKNIKSNISFICDFLKQKDCGDKILDITIIENSLKNPLITKKLTNDELTQLILSTKSKSVYDIEMSKRKRENGGI